MRRMLPGVVVRTARKPNRIAMANRRNEIEDIVHQAATGPSFDKLPP